MHRGERGEKGDGLIVEGRRNELEAFMLGVVGLTTLGCTVERGVRRVMV